MSLDLVIGLVALDSEFVTADGILRALEELNGREGTS